MYVLECSWNFRADHCRPKFSCGAATQTGPKLIHGNDRKFVGEKWYNSITEPAFEAIYSSINEVKIQLKSTYLKIRIYLIMTNFKYNFNQTWQSIIDTLEKSLEKLPNKLCAVHRNLLIEPFRRNL